jgi:hypothetical protein
VPTPDRPVPLTPEQRFRELAALLAKGLTRALRQSNGAAEAGPQRAPEKSLDSGEVSLELARGTVLSGLTGKRPRVPETPARRT